MEYEKLIELIEDEKKNILWQNISKDAMCNNIAKLLEKNGILYDDIIIENLYYDVFEFSSVSKYMDDPFVDEVTNYV